ncbi:TPA: DUF3603 family protein [Bacillus cereus]
MFSFKISHVSFSSAHFPYSLASFKKLCNRTVQHMEFEEVWIRLYDEVKNGWSEKHEHLCEHLAKGQPFFRRLWDMRSEQKVN